MIKFLTYRSGDLHGVQYHFEKAGDKIPEHDHTRVGDFHNIVCLLGSVRVTSPELDSVVAAGEVLDFNGALPHTITALEPSKIINFYLHGRPVTFIDDYVGEYG
jgi:hypothetical protein